jgi:AAA family ATP:ADP antiporter
MPAAHAFITIAVLQAAFRAGKFAIARPARETLFTVVPRDDKYKAKGFIDTFVYRAGDALGAGADWSLGAVTAAFPALFSSLLVGLAVTITPIAVVWAGLGLFLGARQQRLASTQPPPPPGPEDRTTPAPQLEGA